MRISTMLVMSMLSMSAAAQSGPSSPNFGIVGPDKYGNYYRYHKVSEVGFIVGISISPLSDAASYSLDCQRQVFYSVESTELRTIASDKLAGELYVKICVREGLAKIMPPVQRSCTPHDTATINFNPETGVADFNIDKDDCVHGPYQYIGKNKVVSIVGDQIGIGGVNLFSWGFGAYYYIDCAHATLSNATSIGEQAVGSDLFSKLCKDGHVSYVPPYASR